MSNAWLADTRTADDLDATGYAEKVRDLLDNSPWLIARARTRHPGLRFDVGTMTDLDLADSSLTGLLALWSVIHVPDDYLPAVLAQFQRVLSPGGPLMVGFHLDSYDRRPDQVARWLRDAGFTVRAGRVMRPEDEIPDGLLLAKAAHVGDDINEWA